MQVTAASRTPARAWRVTRVACLVSSPRWLVPRAPPLVLLDGARERKASAAAGSAPPAAREAASAKAIPPPGHYSLVQIAAIGFIAHGMDELHRPTHGRV